MITRLKRAVLAAAVCTAAVLPLTLAAPAGAAPGASSSAPTTAALAESTPFAAAVALLPVGVEDRTGYDRDKFRHWNTGLDPADGCNTRAEVLIAEAVEAPAIGARCALTGGSWWSYYDEQTVTSAGTLDIDHMVP
ncbi:HNH endonuclease, partial [Streptomyces jumonjinensis]